MRDDLISHIIFVSYRQLVESGPILKILGKTLDEHYTTTNEQQVVGRKSQRKPDNVQGETTNDPTSLVVDACEKLTRRYRANFY